MDKGAAGLHSCNEGHRECLEAWETLLDKGEMACHSHPFEPFHLIT